MNICTITPDRGDRALLLQHCKRQIHAFTESPNAVYIVDYSSKDSQPDLTERVHHGYQAAKDEGMDWCFIIENDDFYPSNYLNNFKPFLENYDFIGSDFTYYYNLRNRTWMYQDHQHRSSLFCTAFRVSAMDKFKWHLANKVFLDLDIWKYARRYRRAFIDTHAIGVKHGIGAVAGKAHHMYLKNQDKDLYWLSQRVDSPSFEFYKSLSEQLMKENEN